MTIQSISGPANEIIEGQSANAGAGGWFFQQFRVAFWDLVDMGTPCGIRDDENDTCRLVMCMNGDLRVCVTGTDQKNDFFLSAGNCSLQYQPGGCRCLNCAHHSRVQVLELVCPASALVELMSGTRAGCELEVAVNAGRPLHIHQPITPAIHQALISLREVLAETDGGAVPLVLAKFLEMVWVFTSSRGQAACSPISVGTRRAVEKARSTLEDNMADPPALEALAAEVGMSLSKLKQVFPQVCGMPPYAYLRRVRMEQSRRLLSHHGLSVTEAAIQVGYSNLSHFAKIFAAYHGIKPSQVPYEN